MDYLKAENQYFIDAYKTQFDHFMKVFYFWTVLMTIPITAGLIEQGKYFNINDFPIILILFGVVGCLLYLKMVDIRMSQLRYISKMNYVRSEMYNLVKSQLSKGYELPYKPDFDLSNEAKKDFGRFMAIAMSLVNAAYFGFGLSMFSWSNKIYGWCIFPILWLLGIRLYFVFISLRGPKLDKNKKINYKIKLLINLK